MYQTAKPSEPLALQAASKVWFFISLRTFGGPAGQIAVMHDELADKSRPQWFVKPPVVVSEQDVQPLIAIVTFGGAYAVLSYVAHLFTVFSSRLLGCSSCRGATKEPFSICGVDRSNSSGRCWRHCKSFRVICAAVLVVKLKRTTVQVSGVRAVAGGALHLLSHS